MIYCYVCIVMLFKPAPIPLCCQLGRIDYNEAEFKYFVGKLHIWLAMYQMHCYLSVFSQHGNVTNDWSE